MSEEQTYRDILLSTYQAAIDSAVPERCLPAFLPAKPAGKTYVIGAGKAAARMAQVFEQHWHDDEYEGLVVTRYGHALPTKKIKVIEAAHPVPDEAGRDGALEMLKFLEQAGEGDLVICLLSGGGSSLLTCPVAGISFTEIQDLNRQLLTSGASIHEINIVRKHLNQAFGGKIARAAAPAQLITLAISDVAGDDPSSIASGPTVPDPSTLAEARSILQKYALKVSDSVLQHLNDPQNETLKPEDPVFAHTAYHVIAAPQKAMEAARSYLGTKGINAHILSSEMEGDTNEAAGFHVALLKQIMREGQPFQAPCALISGGETTVKVRGSGHGGPNTQFMLQSAILLGGAARIYGLSCDTDGVDGNVENAGAIITPTTLERAEAKGLSAKEYLEDNDSYTFFQTLGDQIEIPPTHTNVNDIRVFMIV